MDSAQATELPASSQAAEYEFSETENVTIGSCANRSRIFGILCGVTGGLQLVIALLSVVGVLHGNEAVFMFPGGVFNIILGVIFTRVGNSLTAVVTTQGRDVTLMMAALGNLARAFLIQIIATLVLILIVTIGLVAVVVIFMSAP